MEKIYEASIPVDNRPEGYEVPDTVIDITGLDKRELLAALYNRALPRGLGWIHYVPGNLKASSFPKGVFSYDYYNGRAMKVNVVDDTFRATWYDQYNGPGIAQRAVDYVRDKQLKQKAMAELKFALTHTYSDDRIHISDTSDVRDIYNCRQPFDCKPTGLWYGLGSSWLNYAVSAEHYYTPPAFVYRLYLDTSKILHIKTGSGLKRFQKQYGHEDGVDVYWGKVAEAYQGVEIGNFAGLSRKFKYYWFNTFDCNSGCIWDKSAVLFMQPLFAYDCEKREYVKLGVS